MKDDAPVPAEIPRKRRALEAAPDVWLAQWLGGAYPLVPSQRARLEAEKARRQRIRRSQNRVATIVVGHEGQTPDQKRAVAEALRTFEPTAVYRATGDYNATRTLIREADLVIAAPRESAPPADKQVRDRSSVWIAVDYAKHRRVPVKIIMPNGKEGTLG